MRVFVFGSLLLQTLNAQSTLTDSGDATFSALDIAAFSATLSVDTEFLSTPTDTATTSEVDFATLDLPAGTADVIVDSSPTASPPFDDGLGDPFGAGETPGTGIEMGDLSGSDFPTSTPAITPADASAVSDPAVEETAVESQIQNGFVAPNSTLPSEFGLGAPLTVLDPSETSTGSFDDPLETPINSFDDGFPQPTDAPTATDPVPLPELPDVTDGASLGPSLDAAAAPEETDGSDVAPEDTDTPEGDKAPSEGEGDSAPLEDEDPESSATLDDGPTASVDDLTIPDATPGPIIDTGRSELDAASEGDEGEESGDAANQDGQYYDDECPWYCYESGDYYAGADAGDGKDYRDSEDGGDSEDDDEGDDEDGEPLTSRLLHRLRRRQDVPSSNGGFAALKWPGGRKRPFCPESCYHATSSCTSSSPTPKTSMANPWDTSSASSAISHSYGRHPWPHTPEPWPSSPSSDSDWPSTLPSMSTTDNAVSTPSGGYDHNTSPQSGDTTTTETQTTFVTSTTTAKSPYGSDSADDTGDTLDSICPKTCNPTSPLANNCDITTSCTTTGNGKYYCACRAGFRASAWNAKDFTKQFRLDSQPYVYTAEGVECAELCEDQICSEVLRRPQCQ
jgi:hypothetical protein